MHEKTNEILVSENTLPVSYLPEKINKLIVSDQVTYLPLVTAQKKITYNNKDNPIITKSNVYNVEEYGNIINNSNNNLNLGQNLGWKKITNSPQLINNNYNYVYSAPNNMSNSNNYSNYSNYNSYNNYNINGNSTYNYYNKKGINNNSNSMWNSTVNSSKIITKSSYPQSSSGNFQIQNKSQPIYLTQQIKY